MAILWILTASSATIGLLWGLITAVVSVSTDEVIMGMIAALAFAIIPFIITMSIKEFKNNGKD